MRCPSKLCSSAMLWYVAAPVLSFVILFSIANAAPRFYWAYISSETGLLEITHIIIPLVGAYFAIRLFFLFLAQKKSWGLAFALFSLLVCLYIAGEEASYGQHFFGWQAGGLLSEINDQQETNLHNISSWFDQKPRLILELAIIAGGLLLPLFPGIFLPLVPRGLRDYAPTRLFLPTAFLVVLSRLPERLDYEGYSLFSAAVRYSELQEFFMFLFITLYLFFVLQLERLKLPKASTKRP